MHKPQYDIVFLSNIPSFYKVKQWNEVAKHKHVLIILTKVNCDDRNSDFVSESLNCEYEFLQGNICKKGWQLAHILRNTKYDHLIIGGWDDPTFHMAAWLASKDKNAVICESSIFEYQPSAIRDIIKKCFLSRISKGYPSGKPQGRLLRKLGFSGDLHYTGGCGLLNYIDQPPFESRNKVRNFIYVGRLAPEKNLEMLISVFNSFPHLTLTIIGFGPMEAQLKAIAGKNILFTGAIPNKELATYYQQADCFILPSIREPWGLVVEEALNNGCPVIVSDKVGCNEDLVTDETGIVFQYDKPTSLAEAIKKICDIDSYNRLRHGVSKMDFAKRAQKQIEIYLD